jgi:photosynthetic reaction center cytochrome c subunit
MASMRIILSLLLAASLSLFAQDGGGKKGGPKAPPKNLQILTPDNYRAAMTSFTGALGVQCTFCHVQGDMASDDKEQKKTARMMLTMSREINAKFPDGKQHVRCYTCHRGATTPLTEPPADAAKQ